MEERAGLWLSPCCLGNGPVLKLRSAQRKEPFRSGINHSENSTPAEGACNGDKEKEQNKGLGSLHSWLATSGVPNPASPVMAGVNRPGIHQSVLLLRPCLPPLFCYLEENVRGGTISC